MWYRVDTKRCCFDVARGSAVIPLLRATEATTLNLQNAMSLSPSKVRQFACLSTSTLTPQLLYQASYMNDVTARKHPVVITSSQANKQRLPSIIPDERIALLPPAGPQPWHGTLNESASAGEHQAAIHKGTCSG